MYRSFLRENMRNYNPSLIRFLYKIDTNEDIKNIYDSFSLLDEFKGIEEQVHYLNDGLYFIPFYQSLLSRISDYAKSPKPRESSKDYKKVLNYLYTGASGRILNLKENSESNLVIRVAEYLDEVKDCIESLKDSQRAKIKTDIIEKHKREYKSSIEQKIKEAESLIGNFVTPEIDNLGKKMDNSIELLMNETLALEKQAEAEKQDLIEKKRELKNAMVLGGLFSVFKIVGQAVSFFGPIGASIGLAVGASTSISESLLLDNQTGSRQTVQLPSGAISDIQSLEQQMKAVSDQKVARLIALLEDILEESNQYPGFLTDTSAEVVRIKESLNKLLDGSKFEFDEIQSLEDEFKQELERKSIQLSSKNISESSKAKMARAVVEKFEKAFKLSGTVFVAYNQHRNDQLKLDLLNDAIEQSERKFRMLKEYESKIYHTITPLVQNMKDDLNEVANQLATKSQVSLDVTKWQMQNALRNFSSEMKKLTYGFGVQGDFLNCIEQLDTVMTTLIGIYDHIQKYQEKQTLANLIADVSSAAANDILITNRVLIKAVEELGNIIKSNLVLEQYKTAMEAFKQFVFPFAHQYLEELDVPSYVIPGDDIESLTSKASREIGDIRSKLRRYTLFTRNENRYFGRGVFSSRYVSTRPFFVWKNEQHGDMISSLLSGQEVLVKADVMTSGIRSMDAVKFNVIDLNFKSKNDTLQTEINNVVKGFEVRAVHLGDSYYRYDSKIYLMETNSQVIEFRIEKKPDGTPVHTGGVYDQIKDGDFMLSPYASWKIRLFNVTENIFFKDLLTYKDVIDLELAGEGHYVKNGELDGLNLHMEKYYKSIQAYDFGSRNMGTENPSSTQESNSGWFSWLKVPNLSILPAAEATLVENDFVNRKDYIKFYYMDDYIKEGLEQENSIRDHKDVDKENNSQSFISGEETESYTAKVSETLLDIVTAPFTNCVKLLKDVVSLILTEDTGNSSLTQKTINHAEYVVPYTPNSKAISSDGFKNYVDVESMEKMLVNYADCIVGDTANSSCSKVISFNGDESHKNEAHTPSLMDVIGNLTLGQLLVHKIFGTNECLRITNCVSPALNHIVKVNQLASEVLPLLNRNYWCEGMDLNGEYDDQPLWYRDLYLDDRVSETVV